MYIRNENIALEPPPQVESFAPVETPVCPESEAASGDIEDIPLGNIVGARSGDKGGNANVGLWAKNRQVYHWMVEFLTPQKIQEIYPEAAKLRVERYELPNILSLNFVIHGLLGEGVSASLRPDPQAKMLCEELRARRVPIPQSLLY